MLSSLSTYDEVKRTKFALNAPTAMNTLNAMTKLQMNRRRSEDDADEDDENDDFEFARVGRRRRRDRYSNDNDSDNANDGAYASSSSSSRTNRQRQGYQYDDDNNNSRDDDLYDEVDFDDDEEDADYYDEEDDDDDYDDEYNDIIPNALLDQIDPDGAIERMPELLSDPQFYRDVAITFALFMVYALNRYGSPLYDIKDVNQIDFSKFY
jgi:hypothetical protein